MMLFLALIATVFIIPTLFLVKSKPPTPPSKGKYQNNTLTQDVKALLKNRNYVLLALATGII